MAQCIGGLLNFNSSIKVDVSEADDNVWEVEMADDNYAEGGAGVHYRFCCTPRGTHRGNGSGPALDLQVQVHGLHQT